MSPYHSITIKARDFATLGPSEYITNSFLDFAFDVFQADNVELNAQKPPLITTVLNQTGPTRIARIHIFQSSHLPPACRLDNTALWQTHHVINLSVVDVVLFPMWVNDNHFATLALDLHGHCIHYYDSMTPSLASLPLIPTIAKAIAGYH